jgi:uncharacterized protein (DUF2141 family)
MPFFHVLFTLLLFSGEKPTAERPLRVTLTEYDDTKAVIRVGVFPPTGGFPKSNRGAKGYEVKPNGQKSVTLTIRDLDYGDYAIAVYQDLNGNGKLDTGGLLGMPQEPYCFSNNFRPMARLRGPRFSDCRFTYSATQTEVNLRMLND